MAIRDLGGMKLHEKVTVCRTCGHVLGFGPKDVKSYESHSYDGSSDTVSYIVCPVTEDGIECGEKVYVSRRCLDASSSW